MSSIFDQFSQAVKDGKLVAMATIVAGDGIGSKLLIWPDGRLEGTTGDPSADEVIRQKASELLLEQKTELVEITTHHPTKTGAPRTTFIEVYTPPTKLIIIGAVHLAIPLVTFANTLGFHTIVIDARSGFATPDRFPHVHELLIDWPEDALAQIHFDESTFFVTLTHDDKFDTPALAYALKQPARYIGALGSRKTHAKRVEELKGLGITDEQIARIHAPIGLDLGGRRPEEIAVSIIAQMVAVKNGKMTRDP